MKTVFWFWVVFWIPLFGLEGEETQARARVCLNMIVKNESHVIERALSSVKEFIDYWVIVDTGSSDHTKEVISETLKDIPGELYDRPWIDFGSNRTEALRLARGKSDYILFMDADDWLECENSLNVPPSGSDVYWARWQSLHVPSFSYTKPLMIKDSLFCEWEGVIHESLRIDDARSQDTLAGVTYIFTSQGDRSKNPRKFEEAAEILERALQKEPDNSRYMFYLAESYRDANLPEKAIVAYDKRVEMGGWAEEVFWSLLQIGCLKQSLEYPYDDILSTFQQARYKNPKRCEAVYYLAELYNRHQNFSLAYECIKGWQSLPKIDPEKVLFHMGWIDDYGIPFQLSIASYYVQQYQECLDLNDELLANPRLPEAVRNRVVLNREFPARCLRGECP